MVSRGPEAHRAWTGRPASPWDSTIRGKETISSLREKLLYGTEQPPHPVQITVTGTLFPSALLTSGWWEKHSQRRVKRIRWRDEVQRWLFFGFEEWGPSWDFTWNFEHWDRYKNRPYFIAQLGDGDESNSLPVLIPQDKAQRVLEDRDRWGGMIADVTGLLGSREHFAASLDPGALELFGGLLDYCLWLDAENPTHGIDPRLEQDDMYSGYLWKCVAPKALVENRVPCLNEVYFVWEHTNFASEDAVRFALDGLERKIEYLERRYDSLILVQKSSSLVPGEPSWKPEEIYALLLGKRRVRG
jgi:hypothetical protein